MTLTVELRIDTKKQINIKVFLFLCWNEAGLRLFWIPYKLLETSMRLAKTWYTITWSENLFLTFENKNWNNFDIDLGRLSENEIYRIYTTICFVALRQSAHRDVESLFWLNPRLNCYVNCWVHLPGFTLPEDAQVVSQIYVWYTTIAQTRIDNVYAVNSKPAHEVRKHIGRKRRSHHGNGGPRKYGLSCQVWVSLL